MCEPSRNGACDAIKSRMACSALLPCALRAAPRRRGFSIAVGSALGVRCQGHGTAYDFTGHRSTHESVETVCLPHATDGPKSRKLHYGEYVGPTHVSPPNPRIKARFQRAALEPFGVSFFHIFLHAKKDMAVGDRRKSREAYKTVKSKTPPPEGVGKVERYVNTFPILCSLHLDKSPKTFYTTS